MVLRGSGVRIVVTMLVVPSRRRIRRLACPCPSGLSAFRSLLLRLHTLAPR
jgi:hypothetical protein